MGFIDLARNDGGDIADDLPVCIVFYGQGRNAGGKENGAVTGRNLQA